VREWIQLAADRVRCRVIVKGNEPLGSRNDGEFLDRLSDYQRCKSLFAPWNWIVKTKYMSNARNNLIQLNNYYGLPRGICMVLGPCYKRVYSD
jgi:hypothetical protein